VTPLRYAAGRVAIAAAPFCHARLVYAEIKRPSTMSESELERAIAVAEEDLLRNGVGRDRWPQVLHSHVRPFK
jgi:hypothetical protein